MTVSDKPSAEVRAAEFPHQLFMFNMVGNHVLLTVITVSQINFGYLIGAVVPIISLIIMAYTLVAGRRHVNSPSQLVQSHWRLAIKRTKVLLVGYGFLAVGGLLGWYLGAGLHMMKEMVIAVVIGLGALPVMVLVLYLAVVESMALHHARHGVPAGAPATTLSHAS